jgi:hypothetical protein
VIEMKWIFQCPPIRKEFVSYIGVPPESAGRGHNKALIIACAQRVGTLNLVVPPRD